MSRYTLYFDVKHIFLAFPLYFDTRRILTLLGVKCNGVSSVWAEQIRHDFRNQSMWWTWCLRSVDRTKASFAPIVILFTFSFRVRQKWIPKLTPWLMHSSPKRCWILCSNPATISSYAREPMKVKPACWKVCYKSLQGFCEIPWVEIVFFL